MEKVHLSINLVIQILCCRKLAFYQTLYASKQKLLLRQCVV